MSACLDDNAIVALLGADLPADERARSTAHLDACSACRMLVAAAARLDDEAGPRFLAQGATLGRYVVLETLGAGAMGVVYAAYDPQLGRKIALKLLRPDASRARGRLIHEAKALAKLQHPHVITIHDVGSVGAEVFLAMEFLDGGSLHDWLARAPRDWRAIVGLMRQVGEGLAAAHAAGLIHRDLKPDNILVDAAARARVTDFGLARGAGVVTADTGADADAAGAATDDDTSSAFVASLAMTMSGALVGTPAYMAPEQLGGTDADASSDQFAFCVTFYEALYGARPFVGTTVAALLTAIDRGVPAAGQGGRGVPGWLRRIVVRGLAARPALRFPSMTALLAALAAGPPISARRAVVGVAVAGVALAAAGFTLRRSAAPAPPPCEGAAIAWHGVWDSPQRAALRAAFAQSGRATATTTAVAVERILDDQATAWRVTHRAVCMATRVRGEASEAQLDARMQCLAARRRELGSLVTLFASANPELVDRAPTAALALPSVVACATVRIDDHALPLPADPVARAELERLEGTLADANALEYAGHYADGVERVTPALAEARTAHALDLVAKLTLVQGRLELGLRQLRAAESLLEEAGALAQDASDDAVAADAWTALIRPVGYLLARPVDARMWSRYADGAIHRLGGDDAREALRLRQLASVAWRTEGKLDEARDLITRADALYARTTGAHVEFERASCAEGLAGIAFDRAQPGEALAIHERVTQLRMRLLGPTHPAVATAYVNEGEDLTKLGRGSEAVTRLTRAIAILEPLHATGGDAYAEHRLAAALRSTGDARAALAHDRLALAGNVLAGEGDSEWAAWALTGIGLDLLALDRAPEAIAPLTRALALRAAHALPPELAETQFALARALNSTDPDRAQALAIAARATITPLAERYGGWYASMRSAGAR